MIKLSETRFVVFITILLATIGLLSCATAGEAFCTVATNSKGVSVYDSTTSFKSIGILYNGFDFAYYPRLENNRCYPYITSHYSAYVNPNEAEAKLPEGFDCMSSKCKDLYPQIPCNAFLAEVCSDLAGLYETPKDKEAVRELPKGVKTIVWGEFGKRYLIEEFGISGFVDMDCLKKIKDVTYQEVREYYVHRKYTEDMEQAQIYVDQGLVESAGIYMKPGETVTVIARLDNSLVQLDNGAIVEDRFIDPQGDHSPIAKVRIIRTEKAADRVKINDEYGNTIVKLCMGMQVEVYEQAMDHKVRVRIAGPNGGEEYRGIIDEKYLFPEGTDSESHKAFTGVKLTEDTNIRESAQQVPFAADTPFTVVGCFEANYAGDPDKLLLLTEDGKLVSFINKNGILVPTETLGIRAKVTSKLNMRSLPDKESKCLRTLSKGSTVEVLLRGESWTIIRYKDQTGYVMSRYLKFQ